MNLLPYSWSFRTRFLLGFVACGALLAYALYEQFHEGLMPCAFCIFQRLAFAGLGLVFMVGAVHAPRSTGMRKFYGVLGLLLAVVGAGIAARHVWVQIHPPKMSMCGSPLDFMMQTMSIEGIVRKVLTASGDCSNSDWKFLGLTMPAWSLLWFAWLGMWSMSAGWLRRGADGRRRFK